MNNPNPITIIQLTPAQLRAIVREEVQFAVKQATTPEEKPEWVDINEFMEKQGRFNHRGSVSRLCPKWKAQGKPWVRGGDGKKWEIEWVGYQKDSNL